MRGSGLYSTVSACGSVADVWKQGQGAYGLSVAKYISRPLWNPTFYYCFQNVRHLTISWYNWVLRYKNLWNAAYSPSREYCLNELVRLASHFVACACDVLQSQEIVTLCFSLVCLFVVIHSDITSTHTQSLLRSSNKIYLYKICKFKVSSQKHFVACSNDSTISWTNRQDINLLIYKDVQCALRCYFLFSTYGQHTHTHTHTYIYIYTSRVPNMLMQLTCARGIHAFFLLFLYIDVPHVTQAYTVEPRVFNYCICYAKNTVGRWFQGCFWTKQSKPVNGKYTPSTTT